MRFMSAVGAVILTCLPQVVAAQSQPSVLEIFDQFAMAGAAAAECAKPDKASLTNYLANFQMVSTSASIELQKRYPDKSKAQIDEAMTKKFEFLSNKTADAVRKKGCDDAGVQKLVRLFSVQAKWQPGK